MSNPTIEVMIKELLHEIKIETIKPDSSTASFVRSINEWYTEKKFLSKKQEQALTSIYARRVLYE